VTRRLVASPVEVVAGEHGLLGARCPILLGASVIPTGRKTQSAPRHVAGSTEITNTRTSRPSQDEERVRNVSHARLSPAPSVAADPGTSASCPTARRRQAVARDPVRPQSAAASHSASRDRLRRATTEHEGGELPALAARNTASSASPSGWRVRLEAVEVLVDAN